jgi:hypothetical protein
MPHDPKVINVTFENGRFYIHQYDEPAEVDEHGDYIHVEDLHKETDAKFERSMLQWLDGHFPMGGYWSTHCDARQGICWFNIPVLMGMDFVWRINMQKDDDIVMQMHRGAGEICERYSLPRGRFDLDRFLAAREKHSRLVLPTRRIPE